MTFISSSGDSAALQEWIEENEPVFRGRVGKWEVPAPWSETIWVRDWTPMRVDGHLWFYRYHRNPGWVPDFIPARIEPLKEQFAKGVFQDRRSEISITMEGGNLFQLIDGRCVTSARTLVTNDPDVSRISQYYAESFPRDHVALVESDLRKMGCKEVTIFPLKPYEATQHVDMWMHPLKDGTILVGEISDESISILEKLASQGLDHLWHGSYQRPRRTVGQTFLAPSYDSSLPSPVPDLASKGERLYPDAELFSKQQAAFSDTLKRLGYEVRWVPADDLIAGGGSLHCVTKEYSN